MKALLAVVLGSLLVFSMFGTIMNSKATAQVADPDKWILTQIRANMSDGTMKIVDEDTGFFAANIVDTSGKTINSFTIYVQGVFADGPVVITGASITAPTIRVLSTDGTFKTVSATGADTTPKTLSGSTTNPSTLWQIYSLTIPRSTLEPIIGYTSGDYASELRVAFCTACIKITVRDAANQVKTLQSPSQSVFAEFTAKDISNGGGGTGPTGKIYTVIQLLDANGLVKYSSAALDLHTFSLWQLQARNGSSGITVVETIKFQRILFLDHDEYVLPISVHYQNPGATDNYRATVIETSQNVPLSSVNSNIQRMTSAGHYNLLTMAVTKQALDGKLKDTGVVDDTTGIRWLTGTLEFVQRASTLTMTNSGNSYTVAVPETTSKITLDGFVMKDGTCNFGTAGTDCGDTSNIFAAIAAALGIEESKVPFVLIGISIAVVGIAVVMKGGKKKIHA